MAFYLSNLIQSSLSKSFHISSFRGNAFCGGLFPPNHGQKASIRGRRIQGKQVDFSSLPMYFLLYSFTFSRYHCTNYQTSFILSHPSSFYTLQESLPVVQKQKFSLGSNPKTLFCCLIKFRPFCSGDNFQKEGRENEAHVVSGKVNTDEKEVDMVCRVMEETFGFDRNMEVVLEECGVNLSHDLILRVLERFKHAWKPAFRFFCWAGQRPDFSHDFSTYNVMMSVLGKGRQFETMVSVLEEMGEKDLLTLETFTICIKTFSAAKEKRKAVGIFNLMMKFKFKVEVETLNCLLDSLGRAKLAKEAESWFEKLEHRFIPNLRTYTVLLNGWCRVNNLMEAGRTWNKMIENGFKPDVVAHNILLEGLLRNKKKLDAINLFEVMKSRGPYPNVRSYTIFIKDLCKHGNMKEATEFMYDMLNNGCEPDVAVYTCLMIGFGNRKKMDIVYRLINEMKEKGCEPDGRTYNALIKMMTNLRMPEDAAKIYKKMVQSSIQPTIHTFNMMMKSYFMARDYEMSCAVWEEMKRTGCCPDENSYAVFIGGLLRLGRPFEACKYLEEMKDRGMKSPQLDYDKFASDISRAGRPDVLEHFTRNMKFP